MKLAVCVLALTAPVLAAAEPLEVAARLGASRMPRAYDCDGANLTEHGIGPLLDVEVGWRFSRHASIAGFADYSTVRFDGSCHDMGTVTWGYREHVFDAGARIQVTARGLFVGLGVGAEITRESGQEIFTPRPVDPFPMTTTDSHQWRDGWLAEAHAGFTFPTLRSCRGCAIQLFGMVTSAADTVTTRLGVGVQF